MAAAKPIYVLDITTRKQAHNVNYTWAHLQTLGGKDDPNIVSKHVSKVLYLNYSAQNIRLKHYNI